MKQGLRVVAVALMMTMVVVAGCQPMALLEATPTPTLTSPSTVLPTLTSSPPPTLVVAHTPSPTTIRRPTLTLRPTRTPRPLPALILGTKSGPLRLITAVDEVVAGDVQALQSTADGTLWLITDRAVARLVDSTWTPYLTEFAGKVAGIDTTGQVWVVSEDTSQIAAWDGASWTIYGDEAGWTALPDDGFRYVRGGQSDAVGQRWFAASHEVRVFKPDHWTTHTLSDMKMDPSEFEDRFTDFKITIARSGTVWIGECDWGGPGPLGGRGARWFAGQTWHGAQSPAASGCVMDITEDQAGHIWLGIDASLWRYDPTTEVWTDFPTDEPLLTEAHHRYIASVKVGPDGDPWPVVMLCGGASCYGNDVLYHVHDGAWTQVGAVGEFLGNEVYGPLFDPRGSIWIQWEDALYRIVRDALEVVSPLAGRYGAFDATGRLWIVAWYEGRATLWMLTDEIKD
ncbi:hypothetical protein TFLX_04312 [Thermoflexales bacterium]|nr:hypothetical protein TFLX_04312 [Thermoflexales bacterium]